MNAENMDQNQIINHLDRLLEAGNTISDIVSSLDNVHVIANYDLLLQKGATNIDLAQTRDSVDPIVVLNNLQVFQHAGVPVDLELIVSTLDNDDVLFNLPWWTDKLLGWGVSPQVIADKCMSATGPVMGFMSEALPYLLDAGAHINGDKLVDKLLADESMIEDFQDETDIPLLQRAGVSTESLKRLQDDLDKHSHYDNPKPDKLSINTAGRQTTKIFFVPQIQVVTSNGGQELPSTWAGRVLEGQTIEEGIATELKEVYGYIGRFEFRDIYFKDYAKDRKGQDIERYGVYITLFPDDDTTDKQPSTTNVVENPELTAIVKEYDGDANDFESLDEIAHDFLINDLAEPDRNQDKKGADAIKAKIRTIEARMHELNPSSYTASIDEPMKLIDWNPPRNTTLKLSTGSLHTILVLVHRKLTKRLAYMSGFTLKSKLVTSKQTCCGSQVHLTNS